MEYVKNVLIGMILGVSNVIPGVSAGTMAVVLNIYDKLLGAISLKREDLQRNLKFLVSIGIGAVIGILVFSNGITFLFEYYPMQTQYAFMGIIVGSLPMIITHTKKEGRVKTINYIPCAITFAIMIAMMILQENVSGTEEVLEHSIWSGIGLMLSGMISAFAMIIPGISGSFIMVTLGTYHTVTNALSVAHFNLGVIMVTGVGVLIGLLAGVKLVKILLEKYEQATYMAILGLVLGSVLVLYPGFTVDIMGLTSVIIFIICAFAMYRFGESE